MGKLKLTLLFFPFLLSCSKPIEIYLKTDDVGYPKRFELISTQNMWNYLLLDNQTGKLWQCQYTLNGADKNLKGCIELDIVDKTIYDGTRFPAR